MVTAVKCPPADFTSDRQNVGTKLFLGVPQQPDRGSFAIIRTRRVGMFRCQAIFDGDNGLTRVVGDPLQHRILHVRAAKYPAATMQMQINSPRLRRCDYAQGDLVALLPDGHGSRPIREHGRGKRTLAPPTRCPRLLSTHNPPFRLAG